MILQIGSLFRIALLTRMREGTRKGAINIACLFVIWSAHSGWWIVFLCGQNHQITKPVTAKTCKLNKKYLLHKFCMNIFCWNIRIILDLYNSATPSRRCALLDNEFSRYALDIIALSKFLCLMKGVVKMSIILFSGKISMWK